MTQVHLLRRRAAGVPHEIVGDELSPALENIEKRHWAVRAYQRGGGVHLHHWQPPSGCRDGITFSSVSLLSNQQCVQLGLEGARSTIRGAPRSSVMASFIVLSLANVGYYVAPAPCFPPILLDAAG